LQEQIKGFMALYKDVSDEEFDELPLKIRILLKLGLSLATEIDHKEDVEPPKQIEQQPVTGLETNPHEHLKLYEELSKQINNNYQVWATYAEKMLHLKEHHQQHKDGIPHD
jgi:hypothetical protein